MYKQHAQSSVNKQSEVTPVSVPMCVDLDGTLLRTDLLYESILVLLKQNVFHVFNLLLWLLQGKAHFKQQIASRVDLDVSLLPFNNSLVDYLKEQKKGGRQLVLVTASNEKYAQAIQESTGLFDEVFASNEKINLSGGNKRDLLIERFGDNGFVYAGNAAIDLKIWKHASSAIVVNASKTLQKIVKSEHVILQSFNDRNTNVYAYLKALRLHQWVKNLLIFVPVVMAHRIFEPETLVLAAIAFFSFGLCASSVYVLNDLFDLNVDRVHPTKQQRAFASGELTIKTGFILVPLLLVAAFSLALFLPIEFAVVLGAYYLLTVMYSLWLKDSALIDVLVLASFYTLRIIAGAAATSISPSFWLLAFSMFIFFSLAMVKRYAELLSLQKSGHKVVKARAYEEVDLETLSQSGITSGYLSILVLALYINSDTVKSLYTYPEIIWIICPLLLYWISRVWLLTRRDKMHEDPVVFAVKDRQSYLVLLITLLALWIAS